MLKTFKMDEEGSPVTHGTGETTAVVTEEAPIDKSYLKGSRLEMSS